MKKWIRKKLREFLGIEAIQTQANNQTISISEIKIILTKQDVSKLIQELTKEYSTNNTHNNM